MPLLCSGGRRQSRAKIMRLFLFWISFSFGEGYIRTIQFFMTCLPPPPFTMLRISYSAKNMVRYRCNNIVLGGKGGANTKSQKFLHLIVDYLQGRTAADIIIVLYVETIPLFLSFKFWDRSNWLTCCCGFPAIVYVAVVVCIIHGELNK